MLSHSVAFPALPEPLLSAADLVHVNLWNIPHPVSANLKNFTMIGFRSPLSRPDRESRRPLPPTRAVLPALTRLELKVLANTWRTSWHESLPLCSTPSGYEISSTQRRACGFSLTFRRCSGQISPTDVDRSRKARVEHFMQGAGLAVSSLSQVSTLFSPSVYMSDRPYIYWPRMFPLRWQDGHREHGLTRNFPPR